METLESCLLGAVVEYGEREEELGCDGAEIMGEGWRVEESGVVGGGPGGKAKAGQRAAPGPCPDPASATLSCDFFSRMCWEWVGLCSVRLASSKGGEGTVKSDRPAKTFAHVYTQSFILPSTATKIEEAGGSIPSFSS